VKGRCTLAGDEARSLSSIASLLALEAGVAEAGVWGAEYESQSLNVLSGITHPDHRTQEKVRYLCDYFNAAVKLFGKTPEFHAENHEFLLDELCFHLSVQRDPLLYVDSNLSHPLWDDEGTLKRFKNYPAFVLQRRAFLGLATPKAKRAWLSQNGQGFLMKAKTLYADMRRAYLRIRVDAVISYIVCKHDLDYHIDEMSEGIRTIVSLLILAGHHEKDMLDLFDRIIERNPKTYPFPRKLVKASLASKKRYLKNLTLKEQFRSLRYVSQKPKRTEHFVFRCFGIRTTTEFSAEYDDVRFVHASNTRFNKLKLALAKRDQGNDFFDTKDCVYAIVRTKNNSTNAGARIALSVVRRAIDHLKAQIGDGFHLDSSSYLTTSNFTNVGWRLSFNDGVIRLGRMDFDRFQRSSFAMLKSVVAQSKEELLKHEGVYTRAAISSLPSDYWIYAEVLFPKLNTLQRIDRLAEVSAIYQSQAILKLLTAHLWTITSPINTTRAVLGITKEQSDAHHALDYEADSIMDWVEKNVSVPIARRLVSFARAAQRASPRDYYDRNRRSWIQAYGQRNSILHRNEFHEETLLISEIALSRHTQRIRRAIMSKIATQPSLPLDDVIASL
jgi:hypothetical protein